MSKNKPLEKINHYLIFSLPVFLFFSYHPVISLKSTRTMNLEFSLPLIWLVLFSITSFSYHLKNTTKKQLLSFTSSKIFIASLIFLIVNLLSIFWSSNKMRGVLTFGILFLIFISSFSLWLFRDFIRKNLKTLLKVLFISTALVCVFCLVQSVLDLLKLPRSFTFMCRGCVYLQFGFPRPTGFAIEPQFMGNLLLLPSLVSLFLLLRDSKTSKVSPFSKKSLIFFSIFFIYTIFLTLSRGAIFALFAGIFVLIAAMPKKSLKNVVKNTTIALSIFTISLLLSLFTQGLMAKFSDTTETFSSAVIKVINQLSLGKINLKAASRSTPTPSTSAPLTLVRPKFPAPIQSSSSSAPAPYFSGYVAESTNIRLNFSKAAIKTWKSSPFSIIFGTGLGSAGTAMHKKTPDLVFTPKEIVQNQPLETLLELGLVGVLSAMYLAVQIVSRIRCSQSTSYHSQLFYSVFAAYFISTLFFSGLPNALHIYLFPVFFLALI